MRFKSEKQRKAVFANIDGNTGVKSTKVNSKKVSTVRTNWDYNKKGEHGHFYYTVELKKIESDPRAGEMNNRTPWFWEQWRDLDRRMMTARREGREIRYETDMNLNSGKTGKLEWGFDLTDFERGGFQKVLEGLGIPVTEGELQKGTLLDGTQYDRNFYWKGKGIEIVTGNNPITGKYPRPEMREDEKDYASYIGIEGDPEKVQKAVMLIKKYGDYKAESPRRRDFI